MNLMNTRRWKLTVILLTLSFFLSARTQVTSPEVYLGYKPGDDFHLATYEELSGYLQKLDQETDRLQMFDMGPTTEGRRMLYAVISSEANMARLEHYRMIAQKLSLARNLTDAEASQLSTEGKVVVWIDSGIHASETSGPTHQFQLAYDLVTGEDPQTHFIRDNVIFLLVQANPDGMTLVADWYRENLGTPFETSGPPVLYHKYAGHDNNRDSFMANLQETRNMNHIIGAVWHPQLLYVQHESAPFPARIWMPPNPEPVNPNIHPLVTRWKNLVGSAMGQAFEANGQSGAISRTAFDLWYPGYADGPAVELRNIPTILTETANYRYATPHFYRISDFPEAYRDLVPGTFYPSPWEGGWWRMADAVAYNLTASKSVLDVAAKYKSEFLLCKYQMGRDVIRRFKCEPPYGWIIPEDQRDPNTTALMLERLMISGVNIMRADASFTCDGIAYPAGTTVIPTSQAFGLYVKALMEMQTYPDLRKYGHLWQGISRSQRWDGAPLAPYDGVGWTLQAQMGVNAVEMRSPVTVPFSRIETVEKPEGRMTGSGPDLLFRHTDNNSLTAARRILQAGGKVACTLSDVTLRGETFPKGSFVADASSIRDNALQTIAAETHVPMTGGRVMAKTVPLRKSRIALYTPWTASMDAGWISYVLDTYGFTYHVLRDAEMRAGKLKDRFDAIILPDLRTASILRGHTKGTMPPQYTGGIGEEGAENLRRFVEAGGVLVCNKGSSDFAVQTFDIPVCDVLADVKSDSFNCPGSLIKIHFDTDHPLAFGLPENGVGYFSHGMAFEIQADSLKTESIMAQPAKSTPIVVAKYPDEPLLLSGWMIGETLIRRKAAVIKTSYGRGAVVLFGFSVHNRAQAYGTMKLLLNALLFD